MSRPKQPRPQLSLGLPEVERVKRRRGIRRRCKEASKELTLKLFAAPINARCGRCGAQLTVCGRAGICDECGAVVVL